VNPLGALGKTDLRRNIQQRRTLTLEGHLAKVPEDARARMQLGIGAGRQCPCRVR
jgi:hypothetical protein